MNNTDLVAQEGDDKDGEKMENGTWGQLTKDG